MIENLPHRLAELVDANLVARVIEPEPAYLFKHNLIQDSSYASLLRNDRRELHRTCAQVLEQMFPEPSDELAGLLARHFAEAGDEEKAFGYSIRAGDAAASRHAHAEAVMLLDLACSVVRPETTTAELIELYNARGRSMELLGRYSESVENYNTLRAIGRERGDELIELSALLHLATLYSTPNPVQDLDHAQELNDQTLALARRVGDRNAEVRILWNLMLRSYFIAEPEDALAYGDQGIALAEELGAREQLAYVLNDISHAYLSAGNTGMALAALDRAQTIWEEFDNQPMLADNMASLAEAYMAAGAYDQALDWAARSDELSERISNAWNRAYSRITTVQILCERGELGRALQVASEVDDIGFESGFVIATVFGGFARATILGLVGEPLLAIEQLRLPPTLTTDAVMILQAYSSALISRLYTASGNLVRAEEYLNRAYKELRKKDLSTFGPTMVALAQGDYDMACGQYGHAADVMLALLQRLEPAGIQIFVADALYLRGKALFAMGELDQAERVLTAAAETGKRLGVHRLEWEIHADLAALYHTLGNAGLEKEHVMAGCAGVDFLARRAPPELLESFNNLPKVRALREFRPYE